MSSSEEEEEILVHVEFDGMLEKGVLEQHPVFFKMIGVEGTKPVMQIGSQTFTGEYHDTVGTSLYFEEDDTATGGDPVFTNIPDHHLRYVCKTRKMLKMSRVFLRKKQTSDDTNKKDNCDSGEDVGDKKDSEFTTGILRTSCDEVTMEIEEDPASLEQKKPVLSLEIPDTSDLQTLIEATTSGTSTEEVEQIVEEQIKCFTDDSSGLQNMGDSTN